MASSSSITDRVSWRASVLTKHLHHFSTSSPTLPSLIESSICLNYSPPELSEKLHFDTNELRKLLDDHNLEDRDWLFGLMTQSQLFNRRNSGGKVFVAPDYNQTMEQQRVMTMKRVFYLLEKGVFKGWLTERGAEAELRKFALLEVMGIFDHSLAIQVGAHFLLWGGAIQFFGTKRHHDKWLQDTENYVVKGCFAMTELGQTPSTLEVSHKCVLQLGFQIISD